jgi:predicted RNA binding protein YcfA (HicA-like mRNA interferase family)
MTAREVIRILKRLGCVEIRQTGSHKMFVSPCGKCRTPVSDHTGDIPRGTLHKIEKDLAPCLGPNWLARTR